MIFDNNVPMFEHYNRASSHVDGCREIGTTQVRFYVITMIGFTWIADRVASVLGLKFEGQGSLFQTIVYFMDLNANIQIMS